MLTGLCLGPELGKCSEDLFFGHHEGKLETFAKICVAASLETLRENLTVRVCDKQAALKLLSEVSRTAPGTAYQCVAPLAPPQLKWGFGRDLTQKFRPTIWPYIQLTLASVAPLYGAFEVSFKFSRVASNPHLYN